MINSLLNNLSLLLQEHLWFAPFLALLAGIVTSVTPCALSSVPLIVGYVGGTGQNNTKRALFLSLTFAIGTSVSFTALGVVASSAGKLMGVSGSWWYILLGVVMLLMALQIWGIVSILPTVGVLSKNVKRGYIGAFLAGVLSGVFSSPCATPVLIVLLGILAQGRNLLLGVLLMLCYSLGHSFLTVIAGTSIGFVQTLNNSKKYGKFSQILNITLGTAILLIAFYMFYLGF